MLVEGGIIVVKVTVDDTNHAVLAVGADSLWAVIPDRALILDDKLEYIVRLALSNGEMESREEGRAISERLAWVGKVGLGDGVVAREEVPLDDVANLSDDVVGVEAEATEAGNDGVGDSSERDGSSGMVPRSVGGNGRGAGGEEEGGDDGLGEHVDGCLSGLICGEKNCVW